MKLFFKSSLRKFFNLYLSQVRGKSYGFNKNTCNVVVNHTMCLIN